MVKTELIGSITNKLPHLNQKDVELAIACILESLTSSLAHAKRIEIRGFGSFSTCERNAKIGRNPKTGESVSIPTTYAVHFKPGMEMRESVDKSKSHYPVIRDK